MKNRIERKAGMGFALIVLSASLVGRAQAPSHPDSAPPASTVPAPSEEPSAPSGMKPYDASFVIGNDDVLTINVWKEPDLSRSIPVRSDGKISLPLVGEVQASGRTPLQLEQDISTKLKSYMTDPEVSVMVQQINSEKVNVLGQVVKPGSYPLAQAATVMDAIAAANGFKDFAKQKSIYVLRQNPGGSEARFLFNYKDFVKGKNPNQNIKLKPHDTVVVP
jgi:polysaccharide export outer membrane protein